MNEGLGVAAATLAPLVTAYVYNKWSNDRGRRRALERESERGLRLAKEEVEQLYDPKMIKSQHV